MLDLYDNQNKLLPDHLRVTKFGKFLRRTKLDELPNLLNIISGRLSFVGPRPLPVKYSKLMSPNQLKRYVVRSGLTGLAQISKLETDNWLLKTKLDIEYINEICKSSVCITTGSCADPENES
jgi:lipopolysaccharide/colanic/teichoic acid biosynthesis glycosyltransferase